MKKRSLFLACLLSALGAATQLRAQQTPAPAQAPTTTAPATTAPATAPAPDATAPADAPKPDAKPEEKKASRLNLDSRPIPLGGALKTPGLWQSYKSRFVTPQGRVVDTANNNISHSEGQGYGMLLAVAANDRATFDRIWGWTRANLMVRDDALLAWRWEPDKRPAISDINNATDGDVLVAWALAEAADFWGDMSYRIVGRRIAAEFSRKLIMFRTTPEGIVLPGTSGFHADDRVDGPVVNLSYYVFPAFSRMHLIAPEVDWPGVTAAGIDILDWTRKSDETLPPDWISLKNGKATQPADGFPPQFAYNAVRIPLYLAWAGVGEREQYAPFMALVKRTRGSLAVVDVTNNQEVTKFGDSGIGAIGALTACVVEGAKTPAQFLAPNPADNYYPATMHLLAVIAVQMRYPSCLH